MTYKQAAKELWQIICKDYPRYHWTEWVTIPVCKVLIFLLFPVLVFFVKRSGDAMEKFIEEAKEYCNDNQSR